jgi:hypothetical protein
MISNVNIRKLSAIENLFVIVCLCDLFDILGSLIKTLSYLLSRSFKIYIVLIVSWNPKHYFLNLRNKQATFGIRFYLSANYNLKLVYDNCSENLMCQQPNLLLLLLIFLERKP